MKNLRVSQIAASNYPYYRYSLDYTLDSLERIGAENIELYACYPHLHIDDTDSVRLKSIKKKLKDHGLKAICLTPEQCLYPVNIASKDITARKRSINVFEKCIKFAAELEIDLCMFLAGYGCLDENDEDIWKRSVESLTYLTDIANSYGIEIALESSPKEYTVTQSSADIIKMIREINSPVLKGLIDTATLGYSNETMKDAVNTLGNYLRHVHVGDGIPNGHLILGDGNLDLPDMINELDKTDYKYYLSLEILNDKYQRIPEAAMEQSFKWIKSYIENK
ncbi:sugar phosphate isomerase/epimerase family protein [Anaerocolumna sp. MB42-C2]|uniref:sugar phosphate isomerase/epimerase family protein n=1 Tax=Anaerocolumna sp. MB42-C2 TaxID=3070997 RepID=UPI0027DEE67F|nr:sugar phosphate isomerase/epimerase family protein [Anaerocolumna sp. MB42-C2]WMJ86069.1 sugar phosphate isomerase/epimerase family protein [Anaerocolumna sp. MB42-C2]